MKAISIQQPWAWAIIHAGMDVENRTWNTHYRGLLAIHAPAKRKSVWNHAALFALWVMLLASEWWLRRRERLV